MERASKHAGLYETGATETERTYTMDFTADFMTSLHGKDWQKKYKYPTHCFGSGLRPVVVEDSPVYGGLKINDVSDFVRDVMRLMLGETEVEGKRVTVSITFHDLDKPVARPRRVIGCPNCKGVDYKPGKWQCDECHAWFTVQPDGTIIEHWQVDHDMTPRNMVFYTNDPGRGFIGTCPKGCKAGFGTKETIEEHLRIYHGEQV